MSWAIGLAYIFISLFTFLTVHPFDNEVANAVCFLLLSFLYMGSLLLAEYFEDKLEKRIAVLEKKLKDIEKGGEAE